MSKVKVPRSRCRRGGLPLCPHLEEGDGMLCGASHGHGSPQRLRLPRPSPCMLGFALLACSCPLLHRAACGIFVPPLRIEPRPRQ